MSNVRDFGAAGNGEVDDTDAIEHALKDGDGVLEFSKGIYRVTRTILVDLDRVGRTAIHGSGWVAKIVMDGPGPVFFLRGTHSTSADQGGFRPEEWVNERMPTVSAIEIEGRHPEADGIRIEGVMQPTLTGVLIRKVRTAVHVTKRARNVLISHCHVYHNTGIGVHFDGVNLHQAIISGSHISYCRLGGVRVEGSEIRNFQITGCDIEYNNNRALKVPDADDVPTAEIFIDAREGTVREGTIASCTIQATYSPNGANIRFIGQGDGKNQKAGMWTIAGNLLGSQETNIHLTSVLGMTITGNYLYSGHRRNLLVEGSRNVVIGANSFGHNPDYGEKELCTGVRLVDSVDCNLTGVVIQDCRSGTHTVDGAPELERQGLLEIVNCRRVNVSGCQVIDGTPYGISLENCSDTIITGTTIVDSRSETKMQKAIRWTGEGNGNLIAMCRIGNGVDGALEVPAHVRQGEIVFDGEERAAAAAPPSK